VIQYKASLCPWLTWHPEPAGWGGVDRKAADRANCRKAPAVVRNQLTTGTVLVSSTLLDHTVGCQSRTVHSVGCWLGQVQAGQAVTQASRLGCQRHQLKHTTVLVKSKASTGLRLVRCSVRPLPSS
jgi:hypothetical protein